VGLVAAACDEAVLIGDARLGADQNQAYRVAEGNAQQRVIEYIAETAERPLPLLAALVDPNVEVRLYKNSSGRREIFTDSQVAKQVDRDAWVPNQLLAGGGAIQPQVSLQYGLVNSIEKSLEAGLARLGLTELPEKLPAPWLDSSIQRLLAQGWLTRLLLMVGMMALLIELGNPGIGLGALVSGLCFLGFFWIEGFNGNVEWLEILLFFGGLFALGVELFALPGFGVFGVTGLMMIFVSLVLAGQTFVWPKDSAELSVVASNLFWVALMGFGAMVGLLVMHKRIERLPMFRWLSLQPGGTDEIEDLMQREAVVNYDHLFGQVGLTRTRLNPSGKAQFGHDLVSVVGSGNMIDAGIAVQVVEVRGNLVIVEEC
jgi:membrane-bound ClpP family serine protease